MTFSKSTLLLIWINFTLEQTIKVFSLSLKVDFINEGTSFSLWVISVVYWVIMKFQLLSGINLWSLKVAVSDDSPFRLMIDFVRKVFWREIRRDFEVKRKWLLVLKIQIELTVLSICTKRHKIAHSFGKELCKNGAFIQCNLQTRNLIFAWKRKDPISTNHKNLQTICHSSKSNLSMKSFES